VARNLPPGGKYTFSIRVPDGEGGLQQKWLPARTLEEAKRLKSGTETRIREGTFVATSRQTVGEFLSESLPAIESSPRAITFAGYRTHVRRHIAPALGQVVLQRLETTMVNTFYSSLVASGLSPSTVHRVHATVHRALRHATRGARCHGVQSSTQACPGRIVPTCGHGQRTNSVSSSITSAGIDCIPLTSCKRQLGCGVASAWPCAGSTWISLQDGSPCGGH
jgi:hypothetical protein